MKTPIIRYFSMEQLDTENHCQTGVYKVIAIPSAPKTYNDQYVVETFTGQDAKAKAKVLVEELNATERARVLAEPVTRYRTRWYCCITQEECDRLVAVDHTASDEIRTTPGLTIIHNSVEWALWSDGKFSKKISELAPFGTLTPAAARLISTIRSSDTGMVYLPGGTLALTKIARVLATETVEIGESRGTYAREKIEEIKIEWIDGATSSIFAHTTGYFEGYQYDLYLNLSTVKAALVLDAPPDQDGLTEFPGFDYDPELGFIRKKDE